MPTVIVDGEPDFQRVIQLVQKDITDRVGVDVRRFTLAADGALVRATPVDTGQARRNWLTTIAVQAVGQILFNGRRDPSGQGSIQQAQQAMAGYRLGLTVYITNNLPYINRLNNGWSKQQPSPGWIERTVDAQARAIFGGRIA